MPCKRKIKAAPLVLRCDPGKETNLAKLTYYLESFAKGKRSNEAKGKGKSKPEKRTRKQKDVARFPDGVIVRFDEEDYKRDGNMHIFVRTKLYPVPLTLDVHVSDTLDDVKKKIRARGVPIDGQTKFSGAESLAGGVAMQHQPRMPVAAEIEGCQQV